MMNFTKAMDMQSYDFLKADENCGERGEGVRFQEIAGLMFVVTLLFLVCFSNYCWWYICRDFA